MKTKTVFRKFADGDIIALFPEIKEAQNCCLSYMHIGQHSAADYDIVLANTKPATETEFSDLQKELENIGYILNIKKKHIRKR